MEHASALIVVDVQNDFCSGGSLPVPGGELIIPLINKYISLFKRRGRPIIYTRDWHDAGTTHFKKFGGRWPDHCVKGTWGADFHTELKILKSSIIISKGTGSGDEGYSAFEGCSDAGISLNEHIREHEINSLFIGGLATDYCVKATVIDALSIGFVVYLLNDAIKGVNAGSKLDSLNAVTEMADHGARLVTLHETIDLVGGFLEVDEDG